MGGPGVASDEPITELHLSAIGEAMNQMMGSASTSMSSMLNKKIDISPPIAEVVDLNESMSTGRLPEFLKSKFVKVSFKMLIGDLIDSEIMQLYPFEFAKSLYEILECIVIQSPQALQRQQSSQHRLSRHQHRHRHHSRWVRHLPEHHSMLHRIWLIHMHSRE